MAKQINWELIDTMSEQQQAQAYAILAKRANQRMRDLKKQNLYSTATHKAQQYLKDVYNRKTFKQSKKFTGVELEENLKAIRQFFEAPTSQARQARQAQAKSVENLQKAGYKVGNPKQFFDFLSSSQFKALLRYIPSDKLVEDFTKANDEGFSVDQIMQDYETFMNSSMTFEQVEERRQAIIKSRMKKQNDS